MPIHTERIEFGASFGAGSVFYEYFFFTFSILRIIIRTTEQKRDPLRTYEKTIPREREEKRHAVQKEP